MEANMNKSFTVKKVRQECILLNVWANCSDSHFVRQKHNSQLKKTVQQNALH